MGHRDLLLDVAQKHMLLKGFAATRVDEICADAGVTKGSFYHHFNSKEEIAGHLLERFFDQLIEALGEEGWESADDPVERLLAFMDQSIAVARGPVLRSGCLLGNFAINLSNTHPDIRKQLGNRFQHMVKMVERTIYAALQSRGLEDAYDAEQLARQYIAVMQGSIVLSKAMADPDALVKGFSSFKKTLEILLSGKKG